MPSPLVVSFLQNGVIVSTDLETDDVLFMMQLCRWLDEGVHCPEIMVIVGEGKVLSKVYLAQHIMGRTDLVGSFHQGATSDKPYPPECVEAYTAISGAASCSTQVDPDIEAKVVAFMERHPNATVFSLKPPRELFHVPSHSVFKDATMIAYGSFNWRSMLYCKERPVAPDALALFINTAFRRTIVFESHHALGGASNAISASNESAAGLFEKIKADQRFSDLMRSWNRAVGVDCIDTIEELAGKMKDLYGAGNYDKLPEMFARMQRNVKPLETLFSGRDAQLLFADSLIGPMLNGDAPCFLTPCRLTFDANFYTVPGDTKENIGGADRSSIEGLPLGLCLVTGMTGKEVTSALENLF